MKLLTQKQLCDSILERWLSQYPLSDYKSSDKHDIYKNLVSLGDNPNADDIDTVIGNRSWTNIWCGCCESRVNECVVFTYYDSHLHICFDCLKVASSLKPKED